MYDNLMTLANSQTFMTVLRPILRRILWSPFRCLRTTGPNLYSPIGLSVLRFILRYVIRSSCVSFIAFQMHVLFRVFVFSC